MKNSGIRLGGIILTLIGCAATAVADYVQKKTIESDLEKYIDEKLNEAEEEP